jgi:predicted dinucleotide-binding enzyme
VLPNWQGKIIVDVTNAYGVPAEQMGGLSSARFLAQAFTGGKLVKGFNHLVLPFLSKILPYMVEAEPFTWQATMRCAAAEIGALAKNLGFAPIQLGGLSEGGLLVQAHGKTWGKLIFQDLIKFDQ